MTFSASRSKKCPPSAMPSRPLSMMRKNGSSAVKSSRSVIVVMMGPAYVHACAVRRAKSTNLIVGAPVSFETVSLGREPIPRSTSVHRVRSPRRASLHETGAGNERKVERRQQARRCRAHCGNRVDEARCGTHEAAGVVVAVGSHHLQVARVARTAGDDDAVAAVPLGLRPLGRDRVVETGDVLDHDLRLATYDPLYLEAQRGGRTGLHDPEPEIKTPRCRKPIVRLAHLLHLDAQPGGENLDDTAPRE